MRNSEPFTEEEMTGCIFRYPEDQDKQPTKETDKEKKKKRSNLICDKARDQLSKMQQYIEQVESKKPKDREKYKGSASDMIGKAREMAEACHNSTIQEIEESQKRIESMREEKSPNERWPFNTFFDMIS